MEVKRIMQAAFDEETVLAVKAALEALDREGWKLNLEKSEMQGGIQFWVLEKVT